MLRSRVRFYNFEPTKYWTVDKESAEIYADSFDVVMPRDVSRVELMSEVLVSHANAALTPRARVRLGRLVIDDGWANARRYDSETARRNALPARLRFCDHHRAHRAVGGLPPISRL